jgi:cell division protein FtsW (lipid II flippase)
MERLPQDLVTQTFLGRSFGLADVQLIWLVGAVGVATTLGIVVRSDSWLRRYKYTWATVGVGLLLLTFVFGADINGQRLTLQIGPLSGQPTELLKVILVVFLAGYLSENRALLVEQDSRIGPFRLPPLPYLAPMVAMWALALGIVVVQRDLGAALLIFGVFLALGYAATGRLSLVVIGLILFVLGSAAMAVEFEHVRTRIDVWLNPFADPLGTGYQVIQALHAFARGGLLGMGLGGGLPEIGGRPPIPEIHTDFPLAALGEELGLVGVVAILAVYLVIVQRGLRIGVAAADDFRSLLAIGLALVVGIQAFIIAAGNLKVLPLTGVTLPFISYGGSSLVANGLVVGLLLALSDKGVEPPPPPGALPRWRRIGRRGAS